MQRTVARIALLAIVLPASLPAWADPPPPDRFEEDAARERVRKELEGLDPSAVATMLRSLLEESAPLEHRFDEAATAFGEAETRVKAAEAALGTDPAPDLSSIRLESRSWRAMKAERAWKAAGTEVAWLARRGVLRGELGTALDALRRSAEETSASAAELSTHRMRLAVVRAELARLRAEGKFTGEAVAGERPDGREEADRARTKEIESRAVAAAAAAPPRLAGLRHDEETAQARARVLEGGLPELESAWKASLESAAWTAEMLRLGTPELAAAFTSAWKEFQEADALATAEKEKVAGLEAATRTADRELQAAPEDPLNRRAQQADPGYRTAVLSELHRNAGLPPPPEATEARVRPPATPPPDASPLALLQAAIETRESMLASRIRVLDEQSRRRGDLMSALRALESALQSQEAALALVSDRAERAALAAAELRTRMAAGESVPDLSPEALKEAAGTDRLGLMDAGVEQSRGRRRDVAARLETAAKRARDAEVKRKGLADLRGVATRKLVALRQLSTLEKSIQTAQSDLPENVRSRLESRASLRMEGEETREESFLSFFSTAQVIQLESYLTTLYLELEDLRRRGTLLGRALGLTQTLVELTDREERAALDSILVPTRDELARLRADEAEILIRTGLRAPSDPEALAALRALNRPVPTATPPQPDDIAALADRIFDARMRVVATEGWLAEVGLRLSRLGVDADVADLQEILGGLSVRASSAQLDAARLAGPEAARIEGLPDLADAAVSALGPPEIGALREIRRGMLSRSALISVLTIVAIPAVAWILLRIVGFIAYRILKRAIKDRDDIEKERRQRAETLVKVFQAALRGIVVIVAGIYVLKQLRVDVTPLMASAGIAGLAVAFGAQPLVRDFFAGFFMLLENQYRIGDVIRIGDTGGVVEQITMRVTILRDLNGVVHYIPNGNVTMVSNMTQGWSRVVLELGVAYKEDPDRVMEVLREVGRELELDPTWSGCLVASPEVPGIEQFADSSVVIRMMFKTRPGDQWSVAREARRRIKKVFDAKGIEIPFPQRVVYHVYPETARPAAAPPKADPPAPVDEPWRDAGTGG